MTLLLPVEKHLITAFEEVGSELGPRMYLEGLRNQATIDDALSLPDRHYHDMGPEERQLRTVFREKTRMQRIFDSSLFFIRAGHHAGYDIVYQVHSTRSLGSYEPNAEDIVRAREIEYQHIDLLYPQSSGYEVLDSAWFTDPEESSEDFREVKDADLVAAAKELNVPFPFADSELLVAMRVSHARFLNRD